MKFNGNNLDEVLKQHRIWLDHRYIPDHFGIPSKKLIGIGPAKEDPAKVDFEKYRADFSGCTIGLHLRNAFCNLDLRGADFSNAILDGVHFYNCIMYDSLFRNAKINDCYFIMSLLLGSDMRDCLITHSNFMDDNLNDIDMGYIIVEDTKFYNCTLDDTNAPEASFNNCDMIDCTWAAQRYRSPLVVVSSLDKNSPEFIDKFFNYDYKIAPRVRSACPSIGSFIGWKKCKARDLMTHEVFAVIVKLRILEDARRSYAFGTKCRCDAAEVLAIESLTGSRYLDLKNIEVFSSYDNNFIYKVGAIVRADHFDGNRFHECAPGIHFFIDRIDALKFHV